jgi:electron transport complex protein RnfG
MFYKLIKNNPILIIIFTQVLSASALIAVQTIVQPIIKIEQDKNLVGYIQKIFPEATGYAVYRNELLSVYTDNDKNIGYAFIANGKGAQGDMYIIIGLKDNKTIKGIYVISHNDVLNTGQEYGDPLHFGDFERQFIDLPVDGCNLTESNGLIDSITGATVSSNAIVNIVREATIKNLEYIQ